MDTGRGVMSGRARQRTNGRFGSIALLVVSAMLGAGPGCGSCAGWTGGFCSESETRADICIDGELAPSTPSSQGASADDLLEAYGGTHLGTSSTIDEGFWELVGLEPSTSPVTLEIGLAYSGGTVIERDSCETLAVAVDLTVNLGNGLAQWEVPAELVSSSGAVALTVVLRPNDGASASGLELSVEFGDPGALATLRVFTGSSEAASSFVFVE